jgi:hypothetical protein
MGPTRFASKTPPFQKFPHDLGNSRNKGETFVAPIYEDRQETLWMGTREALSRIDRKAGQYTSYRTAEPGVGSDVISIAKTAPAFSGSAPSTTGSIASTGRRDDSRPTGTMRPIRTA